MENEINERLIILIRMLGITQKKFCETVGISVNTKNSMFQRGSSPSADMLKLIAENFPAYSINWLLTGKGEPVCTNVQHSENNSGVGVVGNNVNSGTINDNYFTQEMMQMLKKKDEQIDRLLEIILGDKQNK
jgi:transcriptional regulator with XRE-family HTH domain